MKLGIKVKQTLISKVARKDPMRKIVAVAINTHWSTSSAIRLSFPDYFTSEAGGRGLDGTVSGTSDAEPRWSDCIMDRSHMQPRLVGVDVYLDAQLVLQRG